jgi:hypothetical protein
VPIVQNLARLGGETLAACATSVAVLDDVCSFRALDLNDYLDLDWAPAPLEQAAKIARIPAFLINGLASATGGGDEVNPAYREMPDSIWEHPVTSLDPPTVRAMHEHLQELSRLDFLTPATASEAFVRLDGKVPPPAGEPVDYLRSHFHSLCGSYATAVQRQLGVLMWWD